MTNGSGGWQKNPLVNNTLSHFDIIVTDTTDAQSFYGQIFNWSFGQMETTEYVIIDTGSIPGGSVSDQKGALWCQASDLPYAAVPFFYLDDVDDFVNDPPTGVTIVEDGNHPRRNKRYAIFKYNNNQYIGVIEWD